ncbi:hypothetical protein ACFSQ7_32445 [Paenibacillus rhizoplanae]
MFFDNLSEDFFMEVCHGPYMVDHNLFLSPMNFRNMAQGGAFVHNLFAGRFVVRPELTRYTPYHIPHETAIAGYSNFTGGDDRYYNNIFLRDEDTDNEVVPMTFFEHLPLAPREQLNDNGERVMDGIPDNSRCYLHPVGLGGYDEHPNALDKQWWEYTREEIKALIDSGKPFHPEQIALPVAIQGNLYLKDAVPGTHEPNVKVYADKGLEIEVDPASGKVQVHIVNPELLRAAAPTVVTTNLLGRSYHAEMRYEEPDGSAYRFDRDFFGKQRPDSNVTPGPFELTDNSPLKIVL